MVEEQKEPSLICAGDSQLHSNVGLNDININNSHPQNDK